MRKSRLILQSLLATGVAIFFVWGMVNATTIGTNISTGGSLTVTGTTTLDGGTFFLDATNNRVGVGTTTPDTLLDVDGTGTFNELCFGSSCIANWGSAGSLDGSGAAGQLAVWTDADTLTASATLQIAYGGTGVSSAPAYGQVLVGASDGTWTYLATSSLGINSSDSGTVNSGSSGQVAYYQTGGTTLSATSSLYIDVLGKVGIGTSTPTAELNVYGNIVISPASGYLNFGYVNGTNGYGLRDNSGTLQYKNSGGAWENIGGGGANVGGGAAGEVAYYQTAGSALAATSSLFIDDNGKVGIGTLTPEKKLHVVGETKLEGDVTLESGNKITNSASGTIAIDAPSIAVTPLVAHVSAANTYVADLNISEYATGTLFMVTFDTMNTGDSTLNINGLGAVQLRDTTNASLSSGNIRDNSTHLLLYDPNRTGMGAFVVLSL